MPAWPRSLGQECGAREGLRLSQRRPARPESGWGCWCWSCSRPLRQVAGPLQPHGFGEVPALEWTGRRFIVEADLEQAVVTLGDERRRRDEWCACRRRGPDQTQDLAGAAHTAVPASRSAIFVWI